MRRRTKSTKLINLNGFFFTSFHSEGINIRFTCIPWLCGLIRDEFGGEEGGELLWREVRIQHPHQSLSLCTHRQDIRTAQSRHTVGIIIYFSFDLLHQYPFYNCTALVETGSYSSKSFFHRLISSAISLLVQNYDQITFYSWQSKSKSQFSETLKKCIKLMQKSGKWRRWFWLGSQLPSVIQVLTKTCQTCKTCI